MGGHRRGNRDRRPRRGHVSAATRARNRRRHRRDTGRPRVLAGQPRRSGLRVRGRDRAGAADAGPITTTVVGIAATADGRGYWLVGDDGTVIPVGDAGAYRSAVWPAPSGPRSADTPAPGPTVGIVEARVPDRGLLGLRDDGTGRRPRLGARLRRRQQPGACHAVTTAASARSTRRRTGSTATSGTRTDAPSPTSALHRRDDGRIPQLHDHTLLVVIDDDTVELFADSIREHRALDRVDNRAVDAASRWFAACIDSTSASSASVAHRGGVDARRSARARSRWRNGPRAAGTAR